MRTVEEYEAAAMLLDMRFSRKSWTFYNKNRDNFTDLVFLHPDTLKPLDAEEVRRRAFNIAAEEDPDVTLW